MSLMLQDFGFSKFLSFPDFMAEGSIDPPFTPGNNQLDDGSIITKPARNSGSVSNGRNRAHHLRASIGSYSTEISGSTNNSPKRVPIYLRASTGSCHDFCKYGRKHEPEEKPWKLLKKRTSNPLHNEKPVLKTVSSEQTKEKIVKPKPSVQYKNHLVYPKPSPETKSSSTKPKTSMDMKKIVKHNPLTDIKVSLPYTGSYLQKPKQSLDAKSSSSCENDSSGNKTRFSRNKPSPDAPEIIKRVSFPSKKVEVPVKSGLSTDNKTPKTEKKMGYLSGEYSSLVKSKPVKVNPSSDNSDGIRGKGRINSDVGIGQKTTQPKVFTRKAFTPPPSATLSPKLPVKIASVKSRKVGNLIVLSPLKNRIRKRVETNTSNNEKVPEKTLHVIETKTDNNLLGPTSDEQTVPSFPSPSSSKSSSHSRSSSLSSLEENDDETESSVSGADEKSILDRKVQPVKKKVQPVKENHNKTLRKNRVVVSEVKSASPKKLKFRSGKVIDLQSDSNTPRRLRFRRARTGAEEGKGDLRTRTLKKAEVNYDATGADHSHGKIALKHQDVQGKKDAQGLFNNVIEETASKLAESRKSKVKALVGAFETVISLQETSKPSVQAVS